MGFQSDVNSVLSTAALGIGGAKHVREQKEQGKSLEGIKKSIEEYEKKYPLNETSTERVSELKDKETGETLSPGYTSVGADFLKNSDNIDVNTLTANTLNDINTLTNQPFNASEFLGFTPDNYDNFYKSMNRVDFRKTVINSRKQPSFELPTSEEESRYAGINPNRHINRKGGK